MNQKLRELEYVRVISMLAVIMIHVTSLYIYAKSRVSLFSMTPAFMLNQASRFAVPMFVMLSGTGLTLSGKSFTYPEFIAVRFKKIAIPYVIWCAVYFLHEYGFKAGEIAARGAEIIPEIIRGILTGGFSAHLYFVVIMLQMYLIYPPLKKLKERYPYGTFIISFTVSFFLQQSLYLLESFGFLYLPRFFDGYAWLLFPTWLIYFVAGMYLTSGRLEFIIRTGSKNLAAFFVLAILFIFLFSVESVFTDSFGLSLKPQVIFYTGVMFILFAGLASYLKRFEILNRLADFLSARSMTVYFVHILIMTTISNIPVFSRGVQGMTLLYAAVVILSIAAAAVIDFLTKFILKRGVKEKNREISSRKVLENEPRETVGKPK